MRLVKQSLRLKVSVLLLSMAAVGCSQPKPVMPGTNIIPVKAWIVLGPSAGEQIGGNSNRGCRLTQAEINQFRAQLISNRKAFSPKLNILWTMADQEVIHDPGIPVFGLRRRDAEAFQQQVVKAGNWNDQFLNIYFCGNIEVNGQAVEGTTRDPGTGSDAPRIIINDGGGTASSGSFAYYVHNTLEHEWAHYLLRRSNVPPYDSGEHVPAGSQNVLSLDLIPPVIVPSSEQSEITTRVMNGTWNLP